MHKEKNFALWIGLSIPVLMIIFVAASIYIPSLFFHPKTNFLLVTGLDYGPSQDEYTVQNGKLVKNAVSRPNNNGPVRLPVFYIYDVKKNLSQTVSFEDAQKLILDPTPRSPDGYEIRRSGEFDGLFSLMLGGERDAHALYLQGKGGSRAIVNPDQSHPNYYFWNTQFLGWILNKEK